MDKQLFERIKALRQARRDRHVAPDYVVYNELSANVDEDLLRQQLNQAFKEGYIKVHRGINHQLIELLKDEL